MQKEGDDAIYTVSGNKAACFELTKADLFGAFNPGGADRLGTGKCLHYHGQRHPLAERHLGAGGDRK